MNFYRVLDIILRIGFNLIPILLMYMGKFEKQAKIIYDIIGFKEETFKLESFMLLSFGLGVFSIYAYYPFRFEYLKNKRKKENNMLRLVAKELRVSFCKALGKELGEHNLRLNIRRFAKIPFYQKSFKEWFDPKKKYCQVNNFIELCDDDINDKFSFEVSPVPRGLVGAVYNNKDFMYDDKLSERMDRYNLNTFHKSKSVINTTEFAIAKAVVSKKEHVQSIITFDTKQEISIPVDTATKKNVDRIIHYYTDLFGKIIPHIK